MSEKTGYEIAVERIEEVARTGATHLDLSGLGLKDVPKELFYNIPKQHSSKIADQPVVLLSASKPLRVFLWHAPEDTSAVQELYDKLSSEGWMDVWFDKIKIIPGQDWVKETEKAIQNSDVVILCMSKFSEWDRPPKDILAIQDIFKRMPDGSIYIIPLRLENCQTFDWLKKVQYEDYFPNREPDIAYQRILESLRIRAQKLLILAPIAKPHLRLLSVFLCYVKEDGQMARTLYDQMSAEGWIDVWFDDHKILPGMLWEDEIVNAIDQVDAVVVCLSTRSTTKVSFFSEELRRILSNAEGKAEGSIYAIPVRLDDCEIPLWYREWQNLDYFVEEDPYTRLRLSLKLRANQMLSARFEKRNLSLNVLDLSNNLLEELPIEIGELTKLSELDLEGNKLHHLPSYYLGSRRFRNQFHQPTNLTKLSLKSNRFSSFSKEEIDWLVHLNELDLEANQLTELQPEICRLSNLKRLNLRNNEISSLPSEIEQLSNLRSLDLSHNQLTNLPIEIGRLNNISSLELSHNQFTNPPIILKNLIKLKELNIRDNPLSIPPEILERVNEPQVINNYFIKIWAGRRSPLAETKMLVVGQGSVGKTSLVRRLTNDSFSSSEIKTDGIAINHWQVPNADKGENQPEYLRVNIWDFGGQEIMHATHQFFLTRRSLYMLVLDSRISQEENRVEYWLKIIQSFGGESPVLIVGNKVDQHPLDIDRTVLQKKYPNIVGILETSASDGSGLSGLKDAIEEQVNKLPHVRDSLPEVWFNVKNQLEILGHVQNYISQEKYAETCVEGEIRDETSQRTLISFLHDLGVILHFQDDPRLEALGILNPQWVTNGVYRILNARHILENNGVMTLDMLNKTLDLPEYPSDKRLFIVEIMRKFELCYEIDRDNFLIPDLLPKSEPFVGEKEWEGALSFQYYYNVLPTSIITRFIVRMNAYIHKTVWRSGVVLKKDGNIALVKADTEDRRVYIWVTGDTSTRRDFLSAIRTEFDAIHKTIIKIDAAEKVPVSWLPDSEPIPYMMLLQAERQGRSTIPVMSNGKLIDVHVSGLLDGIRRTPVSVLDFNASSSREPVEVQKPEQTPTPAQQPSRSKKILHGIFVEFPKIVGQIPLDIAGKGKDAADVTKVTLGYGIIILALSVLFGYADFDTLLTFLKDVWRFFFPLKP